MKFIVFLSSLAIIVLRGGIQSAPKATPVPESTLAITPRVPVIELFPNQYLKPKKWDLGLLGTKCGITESRGILVKGHVDSLLQSTKTDLTSGMSNILVFIDNASYARFPDNPVTAGFIDENLAKYFQAIYTFNLVHGYSVLNLYEKNSWESVAQGSGSTESFVN